MNNDKIHESWDDTYEKSLELADIIKAHMEKTSEQFDYLVVVPRGGYFPANIVARRLDFGPTRLLHACIGSYDAGEDNKQSSLTIGEMPKPEQINGKKLLIIDEVCDTGETFKYLVDYFNEKGAKLIRSGVLHYKPNNSLTGYKPDFYVVSTDKWIVYPWEEMEYTA
jgi:hypoxanthine phosphoribosyltransferase